MICVLHANETQLLSQHKLITANQLAELRDVWKKFQKSH
jgi:hypothetical protein